MTDRQLAEAVGQAERLDELLRGHHQAADGMERQRALEAIRLVGPLRRRLEQWMAARACEAALR